MVLLLIRLTLERTLQNIAFISLHIHHRTTLFFQPASQADDDSERVDILDQSEDSTSDSNTVPLPYLLLTSLFFSRSRTCRLGSYRVRGNEQDRSLKGREGKGRGTTMLGGERWWSFFEDLRHPRAVMTGKFQY